MKKYKIAIGGIEHETNTYLSNSTDLNEFTILESKELLNMHSGSGTYLGGMISVAKNYDIELVPLFHAFVPAACSGIISEHAYNNIKNRFLESIKNALPLDGLCIALHGAGVAEKTDSIEMDIIRSARNLCGENVVIAATFDLHGNVNQETVEKLNLAFCLKNAPHTDMKERGEDAMQGIIKTLNKEYNPQIYVEKLPLLISPITTNIGIGKEIKNKCLEMEKDDIIECSFFHGFPYDDVENIGASVLTVSNGSIEKAKKISKEVARYVWERKDSFIPELISPAKAMVAAKEIYNQYKSPVVLADGSDNPGGGGPCNSTHLLKKMLEDQQYKKCFAVITDPKAVELAYKTGVGSNISTLIGGNNDEIHGEPIAITGKVIRLTDGVFKITSPQRNGEVLNIGRTALVQIGNMDLILSEQRHQPFDDEIFKKHGIDYHDYAFIGLKSTNHWRAGFPDIDYSIIVTTPGYMSLDITGYKREKQRGKYWPIDKEALYQVAP